MHSLKQQPGETDKAFAAFNVYLNLGGSRSLGAAAQKLHKCRTQIERWSSRWNWRSRIQAYGAQLAKTGSEAAEAMARLQGIDWAKRQQQHREEEWRLRDELIELAREAIRRWKDHPLRSGNLGSIARLMELASKLGRLSSGLNTDHTEQSVAITGKLDVEWELAFKKIYGNTAEVIDISPPQPLPKNTSE